MQFSSPPNLHLKNWPLTPLARVLFPLLSKIAYRGVIIMILSALKPTKLQGPRHSSSLVPRLYLVLVCSLNINELKMMIKETTISLTGESQVSYCCQLWRPQHIQSRKNTTQSNKVYPE